MKKKSTAVFTAILSAALLWGGVPVAAQPTMEPNVVVSDSSYVDSPRLQYLSSVFTDLTINGNRADCQGNFTTFKNVQVDLTVTLQRSRINTSSDSSWSDVTWWSMTWTGPCQRILNRSYSGLTSGYYYRVKTTATARNGNTPLETVVVYSAVSYYG